MRFTDMWELNRRQLISSAAGLFGSSIGFGATGTNEVQALDENSSDSSDHPSNTESAYIGTPIEHAWTINHDRPNVELGSVDGRTAYASFAGGEEGTGEIAAIDISSGDHITILDEIEPWFSPIHRNNLLYGVGTGVVYAIDPDTKEIVWEYNSESDFFLPLTVTESTVYATKYHVSHELIDGEYVRATNYASLIALDRKSGNKKWSTQSDRMLWWPEIQGDTVFIKENTAIWEDGLAERDGQVVALNKATGEQLWEVDRINPKYITTSGKNKAVVSDTDGNLSILTTEGNQIFSANVGRHNYFVMNDVVYTPIQGTGIRAFNVKTGTEIGDLPEIDKRATVIRGWASQLYVGVEDGLFAIDVDQSRIEWQSSLPDAPIRITALDDIGYVEMAGNKVALFDTKSGKVHEKYHFEAESIRPQFNDGIFYVAGDRFSLRAYIGRRRRTELEVVTEVERSGVGSVLANAFGRSKIVKKAQTAVEAGKFDQAEELIQRARRQRQFAQASVEAATIGTTYGVGRLGSKRKQEHELEYAIQAVESAYPVTTGSFEGCNPVGLLRQAEVAQNSLEMAKFGAPIRNVAVEDEYSDIINTLNEMADRRVPIKAASERAAELDSQILPTKWEQSIRTAIDTGDIEQIDKSVQRIKLASKSLHKLSTLQTSLSETPLAGQADNFDEAIKIVLESSADNTSTSRKVSEDTRVTSVNQFMSVYADAASTFTDHRKTLKEFDLEPLRSVLEQLLSDLIAGAVDNRKVPNESGISDRTAVVESVTDAFEAAAIAVKYLDQIHFKYVNHSRGEYVAQIQQAINERNVATLKELAETIENTAQGRWERQHLFAFSPIKFEYVVASLYDDVGYQVTVTDAAHDRGVDVVAESSNEVLAIQVKQYDVNNDIGRPEVQQMIGAMAQAGADRAVVVTTSGFTSTAEETARELGGVVELIAGQELLSKLTESNVAPPNIGGRKSSDKEKQYHRRAKQNSGNTSSDTGSRGSATVTGEMSRQKAFSILGIEPGSDEKTITTAYRERVKETHPDTGSGSSKEFQQVMTAYRLLSDE